MIDPNKKCAAAWAVELRRGWSLLREEDGQIRLYRPDGAYWTFRLPVSNEKKDALNDDFLMPFFMTLLDRRENLPETPYAPGAMR